MSTSMKMLVAMFLCFATAAHAEDQPDTLRDKIVRYELTVNPMLDDNVALELANALIQEKKRTGISISLMLAIATTESGFVQYALGTDGELGFFQIYTKKHAKKILRMFDKNQISSMNLYDPYTNATVGASLLQSCLAHYHGNKRHAVACYNGSYPTDKYTRKVLAAEQRIRKQLM